MSAQNTSNKVKTLLDSARSKFTKQPDSCAVYAQSAYEEARTDRNIWAMVKSLTYLGRMEERSGNVGKAIKVYFDALSLMDKADTLDDYNTATLNRNIASIQAKYFNYEQAINYYDSALFFLKRHAINHPEVARRDNDYRHIYSIRYFKGQNQRKLGRIEGAKEVFQSLLNDKGTPVRTQINALNQVGLMYSDINQQDSARRYFQLSLNHPKLDQIRKGRALHNIGMVSFREGDYATAIEAYSSALKIKEKLKSQSSLYITLLDLGESHLMLEQYAQAEEYFQVALKSLDEKEVKQNPNYFNLFQLRAQALMTSNINLSREMLNTYVQCNEEFMRIQQELRDEDQNRAFNLDLASYWADLEHKDEVTSLNRAYGIWVIIIILGSALASYLGVQLWRVQKRKKMFREVQEATRKRNLRIS